MDVLEGLEGQLEVLHGDRIIPSQEAPPCPSIIKSFDVSSLHGTPTHGCLNGLGRRWEAALAALVTGMDITDADDPAVDNGTVRVRKAHSTSDGKVKRCSEGEAQGIVDSRGRPGSQHPSGHGDEVRSGRIGAVCFHREQHERHFRWPLSRTLSLTIDTVVVQGWTTRG